MSSKSDSIDSSNDQYSELNPVEIIPIEVIAAEKYQLLDHINHGPYSMDHRGITYGLYYKAYI